MILEYSLTEDELFDFNFYTAWAAPEKKSYRLLYYLKIIGFIFLGAGFLVLITKRQLPNFFLLLGIAFVVGLVVGYISIEISYKNRLRKLISDKNNAGFYTKRELTINDTGITERDENSDTKFAWTAIIKKAETKEYIYLYLSSMHGLVIPKRILSKDQLEELQLLLSKNLGLGAEFNHMSNK